MEKIKIGFIGAGKLAKNLGNLFTISGHDVKYGARVPTNDNVSIAEVIEFGDVIILAIPYHAIPTVLSANERLLKGKIIVDTSNPVNIDDWSPIFLGEDSSGEQAARLVPKSKIVKAFNTIFADTMETDKTIYKGLKITAFIASDDHEAAEVVKNLAEDAGFSGLILKGMINARYMDALSNLNLSVALDGGGTDAGVIYFQRVQ